MAEIHEIIGEFSTGKTPKLEHRDKMPYTNAVILELLRYASHIMFAVPHLTKEEVTICNGKYTLPANTPIVPNLWYMHHNEDIWEEPWSFMPERFMDATTGELLPPGASTRQHLMAFGAGPRICPGETLAKNRLFLFITAMYQKYKWFPPQGQHPQSCDPRTFHGNFILQPKEFQVRVEKR